MTLTAQSASFHFLRTFYIFRLLHICKHLIQYKKLCKRDQRTSAKYPQYNHQRENAFHKACKQYGDNQDTCHENTIREVSQAANNGIFLMLMARTGQGAANDLSSLEEPNTENQDAVMAELENGTSGLTLADNS